MVNLIDRKGTQGKLGWLLTNTWEVLQGNSSVRVLRRFDRLTAEKSTAALPASPLAGPVEGESAEELDRSAIATQTLTLPVRPYDLGPLFGSDETAKGGSSVHEPTMPTAVEARHTWFDYHHLCKDGPQAVQRLFPSLQRAVSSSEGIFCATKSKAPLGARADTGKARAKHRGSVDRADEPAVNVHSLQRHLVRTNCMDCLDRTNVVQSVISRWALVRQLASLQIHHRRSESESESGSSGKTERLTAGVENNCDLELPDKVRTKLTIFGCCGFHVWRLTAAGLYF
jgi:hypothetical protein